MHHLIPSHRERPSDDPIFALNREATERRARGESVVNATVGALLDDDGKLAILPTSARVVHETSAEEWAAYAPIAGSPPFLKAVIQDLFSDEPALLQCAAAVATPGGTGALRHALANYLDSGQAMLTTSFFWGPYQTLADECDRRLKTFAMFTPDGALNVAALDASLTELLETQGRALIFLNDPCHNPTGYSMRGDEWTSVVECLLKHADRGPVTVLLDSAYAAYGAHPASDTWRRLTPLLGRTGLLFAWSASKTFTHYGLRVGALVACVPDADERRRTEAAFSYSSRGTWSNCNRGGLAAVTRMLTDRATAEACRTERETLKNLLHARVTAFNAAAQLKGLQYPRYEGGFFVTVFTDDAPARAEAMRAEGVFVVPQKGALRVALCSVRESDVARLVDSLARHVR